MIFLQIFIASIVLWIMFIMVANLYHNSYSHATGIKRYLLMAYAFVFVVVDVLYNFTYGTVVFMQLPSFERQTLTARLKHIFKAESIHSWRYKVASFVCRKMIEPWDWNHCGLSRG